LRDWTLPELKDAIRVWQQHMVGNHGLYIQVPAVWHHLTLAGWNSIFMENHDQPRSINHFGNPDPKFRKPSAKMLAMWQLTLRGE